MANQKDLMVEAAKMAVKQAVKKAMVSAAAAVAPYVGIGCLIVLGIFLFVVLVCIIFIVMIYITCNYSPMAIEFATFFANFIPSSWTTAKALSALGPICDIFKQ